MTKLQRPSLARHIRLAVLRRIHWGKAGYCRKGEATGSGILEARLLVVVESIVGQYV
jgi:hypothetical protein